VDFALLVLVLESAGVIAFHRRTGRGPSPSRVLSNAAAGGTLLLALRASLVGQGWLWIAAWLLAALFAHVTDLALRWRD
jgi:nitroreductase